jgi:hypothetical protein
VPTSAARPRRPQLNDAVLIGAVGIRATTSITAGTADALRSALKRNRTIRTDLRAGIGDYAKSTRTCAHPDDGRDDDRRRERDDACRAPGSVKDRHSQWPLSRPVVVVRPTLVVAYGNSVGVSLNSLAAPGGRRWSGGQSLSGIPCGASSGGVAKPESSGGSSSCC